MFHATRREGRQAGLGVEEKKWDRAGPGDIGRGKGRTKKRAGGGWISHLRSFVWFKQLITIYYIRI